MPIPPIFLVTDRLRTPLPLLVAVARTLDAAAGRPLAVVLREKDLASRELLSLARELRAITRRHGALLIVSGRPDVALLAEADGVHLGGEAPPFAAVRAFVPASMRVGVSLHGSESPPPDASYAFLAPVFATDSKPGATPLGLAGLAAGVARSNVPIVALGGIRDAASARACLDAGARSVAIRGAILGAPDPAAAMRSFLVPS